MGAALDCNNAMVHADDAVRSTEVHLADRPTRPELAARRRPDRLDCEPCQKPKELSIRELEPQFVNLIELHRGRVAMRSFATTLDSESVQRRFGTAVLNDESPISPQGAITKKI